MKYSTLLFIAILFIINSCSTREENKTSSIKTKTTMGDLYANEHGTIELSPQDDNLMHCVFKNDKGDVFDTTMQIDYNFKLIKLTDNLPFLHFKTGGIELRKECLYIHEFSGLQQLTRFIQIKNMYTSPFYKIGKEVTFSGKINFSKRGSTINEIYFPNHPQITDGHAKIRGIINREPYPLAYYSTKDSPQGMFSDTSIIHYRLILKDNYEIIEKLPNQ